MRKVMTILAGVAVVIAMLVPTAAGAWGDCSEYEGCCRQMCCDEVVYQYRVSYFERVGTGIFFRGVEMTTGVWTTEIVEVRAGDARTAGMSPSEFAADQLGRKAGYDCFVGHI